MPIDRARGWWLVLWLGGAVAAIVAIVLAIHGTDPDGLRVALRTTARTSLVLFLASFVASSTGSRWLARNRRYLGVSFAFSHALHLVFIVWFFRTADVAPDPVAIVGGGFAYVLLAAMTVTSFDASARRLGAKRWRRLHKTGAYVLWFIFFQSYLGKAANDPLAALATAALVSALALRLWAARGKVKLATIDPRVGGGVQ